MAPQFSSITMFVIVRIFQNLGRAVTINIPLIPDYVDPQYVGAANSLVNVTITTALLVSTSGMYQLVMILPDQKYIYLGIGAFVIAVAFLASFAVKDVIKDN
jgi:TRAP-type C4-dicarboxylate transport system permease small subunit